MPRIVIPALGSALVLTKKWTFPLYAERRNEKVWRHFFPNDKLTYPWGYKIGRKELPSEIVSFPKGTVLKVDRLYIRKGVKSYDSVSFFATLPDGKKPGRFWAKLEDVNNIMGDWAQDTIPRREALNEQSV